MIKYCIYCASAPSLHRESIDSLIKQQTSNYHQWKLLLGSKRYLGDKHYTYNYNSRPLTNTTVTCSKAQQTWAGLGPRLAIVIISGNCYWHPNSYLGNRLTTLSLSLVSIPVLFTHSRECLIWSIEAWERLLNLDPFLDTFLVCNCVVLVGPNSYLGNHVTWYSFSLTKHQTITKLNWLRQTSATWYSNIHTKYSSMSVIVLASDQVSKLREVILGQNRRWCW